MSYLFTFLAGVMFCMAIALLQIGHADAAIKSMFGAGGSIFMAWVWAKSFRAESATERKS